MLPEAWGQPQGIGYWIGGDHVEQFDVNEEFWIYLGLLGS